MSSSTIMNMSSTATICVLLPFTSTPDISHLSTFDLPICGENTLTKTLFLHNPLAP